MVFEAHCMSFPCTELLLFNYAKVNTVFHSMAPLSPLMMLVKVSYNLQNVCYMKVTLKQFWTCFTTSLLSIRFRSMMIQTIKKIIVIFIL